MYYVPQSPCCTPQPIATPCGGNDPCSAQPIGTQSVTYSGPNLPCTGIKICDNLSVSLQKIDEKICDLQDQIDALVNSLNICCTTSTTTSSTSTTTSTTTILCPSCTFYSVSNSTITPATINYYACGGIYTNAVVGAFSTIYICACTGSVVVPPLPGLTLTNLGACPTTTTTTSSSSTSTSTSTSTSSTTSTSTTSSTSTTTSTTTFSPTTSTTTSTSSSTSTTTSTSSTTSTTSSTSTTTSTTTVPPTTSTTTSTSSSTSTTTTSTTTITPLDCTEYNVVGSPSIDIEWLSCTGEPLTQTVGAGGIFICAETGTVIQTGGSGSITSIGPCAP